MFRRDKPREYGDAPSFNAEVVITAAKGLAALLENNEPSPFGAIILGKLLKPDDAMDDAVKGLVRWLESEIVE
jgi:hypothetical protein